MQTKRCKMIVAGILISFQLINFGCNKSSSTGPGGSEVLGSGSDYFPLTGNQNISGKGTYQEVVYDSTGKVVRSYAASNQDVRGYIGPAVLFDSTQGYPLYGYSQDGKTLVPSNVMVAQDNQSVIMFTEVGQNIVLLPKNLSVGLKWVVNPFSPVGEQVTLKITDSKSSYTNSAGKTYSNVIEVNASYSGSIVTPYNSGYSGSSSYWYSYHETDSTRIAVNINIYFAKGVGLVDVQANQFDETYKWSWVDSSYNSYDNPPLQVHYGSGYIRIVGSATLGRTDSPSASVAQKVKPSSVLSQNGQGVRRQLRLTDLLFPRHVPHIQGLRMNH